MKKSIILSILMINFVVISGVFAQNISDDQMVLSENQERYIALDQLENTSFQVSNRQLVTTNAVFIEQIGSDNAITTIVKSDFSEITLRQNGSQNKIDINETSKEIEKFITQTGNNNTVVDFSFNPEISTNLEITQQGNDLYFERFGSNELSKNLKFNMTGNARSIIIRSF